MNTLKSIQNNWNTFWFTPKDTLQLDVLRIGLGLIIFFQYCFMSPSDLFFFYGDHGPTATLYKNLGDLSSALNLLNANWQFILFHICFLISTLCFCLGWYTSIFKWLTLIGHISYLHRNLILGYGIDSVLCNLVLILCLAPIGQTLSLDLFLKLRKLKTKDLTAQSPPPQMAWTCACIRMLQIQMAICYFFAGTKKLPGDIWWTGDGLWYALTNFEFHLFPLEWLVHQYWLVNILSYFTVLLEISYPFLIWQQKTRPFFLSAALLLHAGIGLFMGIYAFALTMIFGHLIFFRRRWYAALAQSWRDHTSNYEIIYDGACNFCRSSLSAILALDFLHQIRLRDFRTNPSDLISIERQDQDLHVIANNQILSGFNAYKLLVTKLPGLWIFIPLFYIPYFSRAIGEPTYRWIAQNRLKLRVCKIS